MKKIVCLGARVTVEPLLETLSLEERGKKAGLYVVVSGENKPRPTTGRVVAVGTDPLVQELIKVGDKVYFGRLAGTEVIVDGKEYRSLDFNELIQVETDDDSGTVQ
jgi:chaperonin GroES